MTTRANDPESVRQLLDHAERIRASPKLKAQLLQALAQFEIAKTLQRIADLMEASLQDQ